MVNVTSPVHSVTHLIYRMDNPKFFDTYYSNSRFIVETCLAIVAMLSNAIMLLLTYSNRYRRHYAYFAFFRNLLVANVLSAAAQWFTNNMLYLMGDKLSYIQDHCHVMLLLLSANVICKVFGTVSVVSLLGLSVIHCMAVCYPIRYVVHMNTNRVHCAIGMSWVVTTVAACMEIVVCVGKLTVGNCPAEDKFISIVTTVDADITIIALTLLYGVIIGLCLRIALEIRRLQRRLNRLCWTDNLKQERGTFRSIVGLTVTMIAFIFPYHIIYFLSLNFDLPPIHKASSLLYFMNVLPYVKYATDPIFFCRKRIVQWRNVGCIFTILCCRRASPVQDSREDRALMEENNLSGITVAPPPDVSVNYSTSAPDPDKDIKDLRVTVAPSSGYVQCATTSIV